MNKRIIDFQVEMSNRHANIESGVQGERSVLEIETHVPLERNWKHDDEDSDDDDKP